MPWDAMSSQTSATGAFPDAEAPPLLFRSLLAVGDGFAWRPWPTRLVSRRAGAGLSAEQTLEHHAFPAKMDAARHLFLGGWILLKAGGCAMQGNENIVVVVIRGVLQEIGAAAQVEL